MKRAPKSRLAVALCALCLAGLAWFSYSSRSGKQPAGLSFSAGKTKTQSSFVSASSSSSSDNSGFKAGRVLLIEEGSHPLCRRISALLAKRIEELARVEKVEFAKSPQAAGEGAEAPDLFLRIGPVQVDGSGLLSRSTKVRVSAYLGSAPWQSSHYTQESGTPPLVQFAWKATLNSQSTFTGVRTDRYAEQARSIANDFAKAISNELETLAEKFPALPELPADFYGPYRAAADFTFLREAQAQRVDSHFGLLSHNETFWKFHTSTNPVPLLTRIIQELDGGGWKCSDTNFGASKDYHVEARKGDARLEVFPLRDNELSLGDSLEVRTGMDFIAHYRLAFSESERQGALERLFAEKRSIDTLLLFFNSFSQSQRETFFALVEKTPAASPTASLRLAEHYLHSKQTNSALNALLRAKALSATLRDPSSLESQMDSLAKRISPGAKPNLEVTPVVCRELGFIEITNVPSSLEVERDLGEPLLMFGPGERGLALISLEVGPPRNGSYPWVLIRSEPGSRSRSSSSCNPARGGMIAQESFRLGREAVTAKTVLIEGKNRVKFTIQRNPGIDGP